MTAQRLGYVNKRQQAFELMLRGRDIFVWVAVESDCPWPSRAVSGSQLLQVGQ